MHSKPHPQRLANSPPKMISRVLESYRHWQVKPSIERRPDIIEQLNDGTRHRALRVRAKSGEQHIDFVIREAPPSRGLGIRTQEELSVMQFAAAAELTPRLVYVDASMAATVTEYLPPLDTAVNGAALAELIKRIHALPRIDSAAVIDLAGRLEHYRCQAIDQGCSPEHLFTVDLPILKTAIEYLTAQPKVLCHNDLNPSNVRAAPQGAVAIDWEYAGMGNAYFDAAACFLQSPELSEDTFLAGIFGSHTDFESWHHAKRLYRAIEWNWYAATAPFTHDNRQWETLCQQIHA